MEELYVPSSGSGKEWTIQEMKTARFWSSLNPAQLMLVTMSKYMDAENTFLLHYSVR